MFTGLVEAIGTVVELEIKGVDATLSLAPGKLLIADIHVGDSIAVDGVCLTATNVSPGALNFDLSVETLARTTLGKLVVGDEVNLEKALAANGRFGGHFVTGHIDGKGQVLCIEPQGQTVILQVKVEHELARYIAEKGSICINGVSLTVNKVNGDEFAVSLIPHTLAETTLKNLNQDHYVNIEVDLIARYLERLSSVHTSDTQIKLGISEDFLRNCGFIKN